MNLTQHYIRVENRLVHYRRSGNGPVLIMLHPSPGSGAMLQPLVATLQNDFTCLALDTPGYGLSDALPIKPQNLGDYARALATTLDALGLPQVLLYGQATGAQIAIEFAKLFPQRILHLVVDSAAYFSGKEVSRWIPKYFPVFKVRDDGSHLAWVWSATREMATFFPWMVRSNAARFDRPLPPATALHNAALDLLRAGSGWRDAYIHAFRKEIRGVFEGLSVPTSVVFWQDSALREYTWRIDDLRSPCARLDSGIGFEARAASIHETLRTAINKADSHSPATQAPTSDSLLNKLSNDFSSARWFVNTPAGAIHGRSGGFDHQINSNQGRSNNCTLVLHAPLGSSALELAHLDRLSVHGLALCIDLPGHGETSILAEGNITEAHAQQTKTLKIALEACGFQPARLIQKSFSIKYKHKNLFSTKALTAFEAEPLPDLAARHDGTHFLAAWHYVRDSYLWQPWCVREPSYAVSIKSLTAKKCHSRTVELLKVRAPQALQRELALSDFNHCTPNHAALKISAKSI